MKNLLLASTALALCAVSSEASAYERWLRIHNNTSEYLCEVYISHVDDYNWQNDRIDDCIEPGDTRTVDPGWQVGYCKMDMKFVFDDGDEAQVSDYNICEGEDYYIYD